MKEVAWGSQDWQNGCVGELTGGGSVGVAVGVGDQGQVKCDWWKNL